MRTKEADSAEPRKKARTYCLLSLCHNGGRGQLNERLKTHGNVDDVEANLHCPICIRLCSACAFPPPTGTIKRNASVAEMKTRQIPWPTTSDVTLTTEPLRGFWQDCDSLTDPHGTTLLLLRKETDERRAERDLESWAPWTVTPCTWIASIDSGWIRQWPRSTISTMQSTRQRRESTRQSLNRASPDRWFLCSAGAPTAACSEVFTVKQRTVSSVSCPPHSCVTGGNVQHYR